MHSYTLLCAGMLHNTVLKKYWANSFTVAIAFLDYYSNLEYIINSVLLICDNSYSELNVIKKCTRSIYFVSIQLAA